MSNEVTITREKLVESELFGLATLIRGWIVAGARTDEIMRRLDAPHGAGRWLLDRAVMRRDAGAAYGGLPSSEVCRACGGRTQK